MIIATAEKLVHVLVWLLVIIHRETKENNKDRGDSDILLQKAQQSEKKRFKKVLKIQLIC